MELEGRKKSKAVKGAGKGALGKTGGINLSNSFAPLQQPTDQPPPPGAAFYPPPPIHPLHECGGCGAIGKHYRRDCPHLQSQCRLCFRMGHIGRACRSPPASPPDPATAAANATASATGPDEAVNAAASATASAKCQRVGVSFSSFFSDVFLFDFFDVGWILKSFGEPKWTSKSISLIFFGDVLFKFV